MQTSTAIAIVLAPLVHGLFYRLFLKPVTGYLQRRIKSAKLRRFLFMRIG